MTKDKSMTPKYKTSGNDIGMCTIPDEKVFLSDYGYGQIVSIAISSWTDFFSLVQHMQYGEWYFRGHENSSWTLKTGLDRVRKVWDDRFKKSFPSYNGKGVQLLNDYDFIACENRKPFERKLEFIGITEFRSLTKGRFDASFTNIDHLGAMQHYGTRTRLLDFTFSPFVATFFAFENEEEFSERAVYAININRLRQYSPMMKDVEDFLGCEEWEELSPFAERLRKFFTDRHPNSWEVYRVVAEMDIVQSEEDALERSDIIPIVLEGGNNRLIAQDGLFLLPLTFDYFDHVLSRMLKVEPSDIESPALVKEKELVDLINIIQGVTMIKFIFDKNLNDSAHQVLKQMNLSDRVIYPDLVGIARSINGIREDMLRKNGRSY